MPQSQGCCLGFKRPRSQPTGDGEDKRSKNWVDAEEFMLRCIRPKFGAFDDLAHEKVFQSFAPNMSSVGLILRNERS
jgi:hypothetical protein